MSDYPKEYSWTHIVHGTEANLYRELATVPLLHLLQWTASDASLDAGFGIQWFYDNDCLWLVRRTAVEIFEPVQVGAEVTSRTWCSSLTSVRSQREYEVRVDGRVCVRGVTDWVYMRRSTGRLVRPPAGMAEWVRPVEPLSRPRFVARRPLVAPDGVVRSGHLVTFDRVDTASHVNNGQYAAFLENDLRSALVQRGCPLDPPGSGGHLWLSALDIQYLEEAGLGDELEGEVWVTDVAPGEFGCAHRLTRADDTRVISAHSRWRWSGTEPWSAQHTRAIESLR